MSESPPGACLWCEGVGFVTPNRNINFLAMKHEDRELIRHIYPQSTVPGARRSHSWFLDTNHGFRGTISYREFMGSGVQKVLHRNHGARAPLNKGHFSQMFIFFKRSFSWFVFEHF